MEKDGSEGSDGLLKVVLVDDEELIVKGLCEVIDWGKYGCRVVGAAHSAAEALPLIRGKRPDILFTDIRMPGIDGLSMIAGLRADFPDLQICILTGYRDFEYAQRAIKLGVARFLLKPSKMKEIDEALTAMTGKIRGRRSGAGNGGEPEQEQTDAVGSLIVRNALSYIDAHYADKLTLKEVADHVYVSQWYLSKRLNRTAGKSFCDLLNEKRIEKAKSLMRDPSLKLHEIAEMVGFGDVAYFSRIFRKEENEPPNVYRQKHF